MSRLAALELLVRTMQLIVSVVHPTRDVCRVLQRDYRPYSDFDAKRKIR